MPEPKTYVPSASAKEIEFRNGGKMLKIGFKASALIEFIRAHTNDRGFIDLCVARRTNVGEHGQTHSVWLDTFQPRQKPTTETVSNGVSQMRQAVNKPANPQPEDDDVPF